MVVAKLIDLQTPIICITNGITLNPSGAAPLVSLNCLREQLIIIPFVAHLFTRPCNRRNV